MKDQQSNGHDEQTLEWIQACINLSRKKVAALMQNDLVTLERCLDEEIALLSVWSPAKSRTAVPGSLVNELRSLNQRNRVLVATGLEFSKAVLDAIRPPTTYGGLVPGRAFVDTRPEGASESLLSVKC
jgi:hypothetical protein